jgi:DNA-binding response OmpR family regulator
MEPKGRIFIVEDEQDIAEMIAFNLEKEGYKVFTADNGKDALAEIKSELPDLVLLDVMLPDMDGFEICKQLRAYPPTKKVPIIFVSAKSQETDKVVGLELGADDYLTKPFSPRELVARIKAVFRRVPNATARPAEKHSDQEEGHHEIVIDAERHRVMVDGKKVELTPTEFSILSYLAQHPGFVHTREKLLGGVFGYGSDVYDRTVDAHIKSLRRKLGVAKEYIETVRGIGYRFRDD